MSASTAPAAPESTSVELPAVRHARRAVILLGLAVFQFWLWGTRIANLLGETASFSAAFVAVHLVLYATAIGAGVVLGVMGVRMLREVPGGPRAALGSRSR
ncbi:MAG: hypothetical protein JJT89_02000 [Nitriliruptoraceae bacterium]|nr:hypothetical protein [Nitriliruptoraceae bacterium]